MQHLKQVVGGAGVIQCRGQRLLGQFFAGGIAQQRQVGIAQRWQAEQLPEQNLTCGRAQQIGATHHIADALGSVIHHHRQLIGVQAIGATQYEVTHLLRWRLLLRSENAVVEIDYLALQSQASCACRSARWQAIAAGAWVDLFAVAQPAGVAKPTGVA